ncbi:unnamed protein product, partial [Lepidochelys olivacea]
MCGHKHSDIQHLKEREKEIAGERLAKDKAMEEILKIRSEQSPMQPAVISNSFFTFKKSVSGPKEL